MLCCFRDECERLVTAYFTGTARPVHKGDVLMLGQPTTSVVFIVTDADPTPCCFRKTSTNVLVYNHRPAVREVNAVVLTAGGRILNGIFDSCG